VYRTSSSEVIKAQYVVVSINTLSVKG